jgi:hypothetical protein
VIAVPADPGTPHWEIKGEIFELSR